VNGCLCAVKKLLATYNDFGVGQRFRRECWAKGTFWHIVDVDKKIWKPGSTQGTKQKLGSTEGEESAPDRSDEHDDREADSTPAYRVRKVFGVKFEGNAPTTGRVLQLSKASTSRPGWVPVAERDAQ
jgi:hypothetical protein